MIIIIPVLIVVCIAAWILKPEKGMPASRKYAIFIVSVTSIIFAIAAIVFQLLQNATGNVEVANISNTLFIAGLLLILAAVLALVGFAVAHKAEIARGLGFGICIAVLVSIVELGVLEWLAGV